MLVSYKQYVSDKVRNCALQQFFTQLLQSVDIFCVTHIPTGISGKGRCHCWLYCRLVLEHLTLFALFFIYEWIKDAMYQRSQSWCHHPRPVSTVPECLSPASQPRVRRVCPKAPTPAKPPQACCHLLHWPGHRITTLRICYWKEWAHFDSLWLAVDFGVFSSKLPIVSEICVSVITVQISLRIGTETWTLRAG